MEPVSESTLAVHAHRRRTDAAAPLSVDYSSMNDGDGKDGLMTMDGNATGTRPSDSHTRSLVKGITWRFLATSTTTFIAWLVTGEVEAALQIGLIEFVAKLIIYYLHERIWTRIDMI